MAGGLFSRLKTWIKGEDFKAADINAEFNNVITNFIPTKVDDYSATVGQMQSTLNPGAVGTEVQATSLAEEIRELRYQITAISGGAQWYSAPANTISALSTLITNGLTVPACRIQSGKVDANNQPMFITAVVSSQGVTMNATATNLSTYINNSAVIFTADITNSGLSLATSTNNTATVNDTALNGTGTAGTQASKTLGENGTVITVDAIGTAISNLNGTYQAFKIVNNSVTEYFFALVDSTNNRLKNAQRGYFFDTSNATVPRAGTSDNDTITLMKAGYVFALNTAGVPSLDITYNMPLVALTQPTGPSTGDYWFDLATNLWKRYSGSAYVDVSAIPLGIVVMNSANSIAARSFDFYKPYSTLNTMSMAYSSTTAITTIENSNRISVYGSQYSYERNHTTWTNSTNCDSGVTVGNSTTYWFYVTDTGNIKISDIAPLDRSRELLGFYHPSKPWRCVGQDTTNGSAQFQLSTLSYGPFFTTGIEPVVFQAGGSTTTADNSTPIVINGTEIIDTHNAYNASTGRFTAPRSGLYGVSAGVLFPSTALTIGDVMTIAVYVNTVLITQLCRTVVQTTATFQFGLTGAAAIKLAAGDVMDVRCFSTVSMALAGGTVANYFSAVRETY